MNPRPETDQTPSPRPSEPLSSDVSTPTSPSYPAAPGTLKKIEKSLESGLEYGAEYAAEEGLETGLRKGVVAGVESGAESFVVNAAEETVENLLTAFPPDAETVAELERSRGASPSNLAKFADNSDKTDNSGAETPSAPKKKRWTRRVVALAKLTIVVLVLVWIASRLQKDWTEISQYDWRPRFGWLTVSGGLYLAAFFPAACFWFLSLRWLGQTPTFFGAVKAFYVSQLGKYLPGKAMVVVIRSGMVAGERVKASIAAVCVFYETLTMMATGAFLSALVVLIWFREHWTFSLMALGTMVASGLPLIPPLFIRILSILRIGKNDPTVQARLRTLTFRSLFVGAGLMTILWFLFGLALWAAILGLGIAPGPFLGNLPRYVSATALAIVLGFAVPISPGGLGIREAVLAILLIPYFETILHMPENAAFSVEAETLATIVSLMQRLVSIIAELAIAAAFFAGPVVVRFARALAPRDR